VAGDEADVFDPGRRRLQGLVGIGGSDMWGWNKEECMGLLDRELDPLARLP
jgi:hypothetical protein